MRLVGAFDQLGLELAAQLVAVYARGHVFGLDQNAVALYQADDLFAARRLDHAHALVALRQVEQVAPPALVAGLATQAAHDGRHDVDLGAHGVVDRPELLLNARGNQQQRHIETAQVQLGDLLVVAETVVANDHEQGVLEVRLFARLLEELAQRPVRITHGGQVLVQAALAGHLLDGQVFGQRIRGMVGQGLQQRIDRLLAIVLGQLLVAAVEHVLVGHAPGGVREHRVDEVVAANEGGHALVAEEPGLVVPGEVAVVDVDVVVVTGAEQGWQTRQLVAAFRGLHQVFEARQVGEARHGGEHALVGVRAVGEEAVEQQALFGQLVEVRGDVVRATQRTDRVAGKAFHQDHHHVLDRQGALGRRQEVAAHGSFVGIDQGVVRRQQLLAHGFGGQALLQYRLPDVGAVFAEAALGGVDQGQGAVQAQLVDEVGVGGERIAPAHWRALAQRATGGDHGHQQDHHEHGQAVVPRRHALCALAPGDAVDALEQQAQQPGAESPGQQVAHHREAVPEHAQYGFRVFLDVLEDQAVEALVELAVEVHFHQAKEHHHAGGECQPETEHPSPGHGPGAEHGQQQRNAEVHHHPQVEAQAIDEAFGDGGVRGIADHIAVVDQQRQAHEAEHQHDHQAAEQRVGQVGFQGGRERCSRAPLLQGVRVSHEWEGPRIAGCEEGAGTGPTQHCAGADSV